MMDGNIVLLATVLYIVMTAIVVFFFGEKIKPLKCFEIASSLRLGLFLQRFLTVYLTTWVILVVLFIIIQLGRGLAHLITAPV